MQMIKLVHGTISFFLAMTIILASWGSLVGAFLLIAWLVMRLFPGRSGDADLLWFALGTFGISVGVLIILVGSIKVSYHLTQSALLCDANEMCDEIPSLVKTLIIGSSVLVAIFLALKALGWFLWFVM